MQYPAFGDYLQIPQQNSGPFEKVLTSTLEATSFAERLALTAQVHGTKITRSLYQELAEKFPKPS
jgi:hypothetical protein